MSDTIFALSSGVGRAAVAVIRLSGPATRDAVLALAGSVPPARMAALRTLKDPVSGETLDEGLVLFFPEPRSSTGEDVAELQVHGGRAVVAGLLAALSALPACRLAEPGEFTRRALDHGRLDLTRVEGIGDLIAADTPQQRRQALAQAGGALSQRVEAWRGTLIAAMAELEAEIDFADEGDVADHDASDELLLSLTGLRRELAAVLDDGRRGEIIRDGLRVVIAGPPNAGKSTLLNALAQRDVAIVSDVPGTTRDVLAVHLDCEGYPVTLLDTAGMRETPDRVESMGMARAVSEVEAADLVLWLSPAAAPEPPPSDWPEPLIITSMIDSGPKGDESTLGLSALTGEGLSELVALIAERAAGMAGQEPALVTRERHRNAVRQAIEGVERACNALQARLSPEIAAEELRLSARALGRIIGVVDVEDVLDSLFASFCIGK